MTVPLRSAENALPFRRPASLANFGCSTRAGCGRQVCSRRAGGQVCPADAHGNNSSSSRIVFMMAGKSRWHRIRNAAAAMRRSAQKRKRPPVHPGVFGLLLENSRHHVRCGLRNVTKRSQRHRLSAESRYVSSRSGGRPPAAIFRRAPAMKGLRYPSWAFDGIRRETDSEWPGQVHGGRISKKWT
jgi:hypothetical protein